MTLDAGTVLGRYVVQSRLGAGGMGEVYLAQDKKLDRKVALKVLPAEVASHRDRMERFVREAKSAAALNHPNIATIHEIGEYRGTHFIAMEFVDGQTLREIIHRRQTELQSYCVISNTPRRAWRRLMWQESYIGISSRRT